MILEDLESGFNSKHSEIKDSQPNFLSKNNQNLEIIKKNLFKNEEKMTIEKEKNISSKKTSNFNEENEKDQNLNEEFKKISLNSIKFEENINNKINWIYFNYLNTCYLKNLVFIKFYFLIILEKKYNLNKNKLLDFKQKLSKYT